MRLTAGTGKEHYCRHSYTLQWYLSSDGGTPNDFDAEVNGTTLFSMTNLPATP